MICLKNDRLTLSIDPIGAEMRSVLLDGKEMLWNGDPAVWSGCAPVLFPVCGGFPQDKFEINGKVYDMPKHGFAKLREFSVERSSKDFVTFLLKSDEETRAQFPWDFELRITYTLHGASIDVTYSVDNCSDSDMYFSIGSHEGHACPEGIEDYDLIFDQKETLDAWVLNGNLLEHRTERVLFESKTLPLYEKYFKVDALVFKDVRSRRVTLRNRKNGRSVQVSFPGKNFLVLWMKPGAPYLCIEPWCGVQGMIDDVLDITQKEGVERLTAGARFERTHTISY